MKKIGIAAMAAVAAASLWAADARPGTQVYEMTMTLKTTVSKSGSVTPVVCDTPTQDVDLYRKQQTVKIKGLFWGCGCETIGEPQKISDPSAPYGYIFWNETSRTVIAADFGWRVLGRIDRKLKKVEGAWMLEDDTLALMGGGFGSLKDAINRDSCYITATVVTPMSGNVAGYMSLPAVLVKPGTPDDCPRCGEVTPGTDDVVAYAPSWSLCECAEGSEFTAVSGTWRLKYLTAVAKKWSDNTKYETILQAYSFPAYVVTYINSLQ